MGYPIRYEVYTCNWLTSNYVKCWTLFCSCRAQQLKIKLFNLITRTKLTSAVWRLSCRLARVWIVQKYKKYENATWKILKKIQSTINKQFWVDKCDIKMHVNNATSVDQWNYDSDRVCNLSLNFIEFFLLFSKSTSKRTKALRERARISIWMPATQCQVTQTLWRGGGGGGWKWTENYKLHRHNKH